MNRDPAPAEPAVPSDWAELTPAWLTAALRRGGLAGIEVRDADVRSIAVQEEARSRYAAVRLAYAGCPGDAPATLFAKLTADWPVDGLLGNQYGREIAFYETIAPRLRVRVPRFYYGAASEDGRAGVILLEDMVGSRQGSSRTGSTEQDVESALRILAGLHAQWWNRPELDAWPFLFELPADSTLFRERLGEALESPGIRAAALGPRVSAALVGLAARFDAVLARFRRRPWTLVHFDFRPENLFFGVDGREDGVATFDWGMVGRGPGAYDVANFTVRATRPDSPAEALAPLERYCEMLRELGVDAAPEALLDDYRLSVLLFLFEWALNVAREREWPYADTMLGLGARHAELIRVGDAL